MSDRAQRIALWVLAVALVVGTGLALRYARGYRPLAGFGGGTPFPSEVALRFENVRIVGRYEGQKAWSVKAGVVESFRDQRTLTFSGSVQATVLDKGRTAATLAAPTAHYDQVDRTLSVSNGIRAVLRGKDRTSAEVSSRTATYSMNARALSVSGGIVCRVRDLDIRTEQLTWDATANQAVCPGRVTASSLKGQVSGQQLQVDIGTRDFTVRNVKARFHVDSLGELPL